MRRRPAEDTMSADHDSFLDIVANIVGILIILVMVVSVRARNAPVGDDAPQQPPVDLDTPRAAAASLEQDVHRQINEIRQVDALLTARDRERQAMANLLAAAENALSERRATLDTHQGEAFDLNRQLTASRARLDAIELERIRMAGMEPQVVQVESLPTPLSEAVFDREVHFQLRGGRLAYIPVEELFEEAKAQSREKTWKLDGVPEATETIGPRDGFTMRYTLEKTDLPLAVRLETGRTGYMIRSKSWEILPTDSRLGEPLADALGAGSRFRQAMRGLNPEQTTITVWTYPDSFDEFRQLKKELFQSGFATAARPLPEGVPIAGSPNGSRSNAQ